MKFLLVLLVIVCGAVGQKRYNPCNDVPGGNGFVNDLSSCDAYYSCVNYLAFSVSCPPPFHYLETAPGQGLCHYPDVALCQPCPPQGIVQIHKPGSCTDFTLCIDGAAVDRVCGAGQSFSRQYGVCVNADEVNCTHDIPRLPNLPSI